MQKFVQYEKLSKKEQKKLNNAKRKLWSDYGCISPVSKIVVDKKKQESKRICRTSVPNR